MSDRFRMILRWPDDQTNKAVVAEPGVHERTVGKWRRRFVTGRIDGLSDEPRSGRQRIIENDQVAHVIEQTLTATLADAIYWSPCATARETVPSHTTTWRILDAFGLQPHRSETLELSGDPPFVPKVHHIFGLYLSPRRLKLMPRTLDSGGQVNGPQPRRSGGEQCELPRTHHLCGAEV